MSTFAKYMDRYKNRLKTEAQEAPASQIATSRLTTDRNAYIAFLEVQLERLTQSCNEIQRNQEKFSHLDAQVTHNSEKLANVYKLLSSDSVERLDERLTRI